MDTSVSSLRLIPLHIADLPRGNYKPQRNIMTNLDEGSHVVISAINVPLDTDEVKVQSEGPDLGVKTLK